MYNVACAVKKTSTMEQVTVYKNIDVRNARAAIHRARVTMAMSSGVTRSEVKVKCFCTTERNPESLPPACDMTIRPICELLK